ncbi:hypothetical protein PNOK_0169500 [Pyrrhoderma noxium]|uniref:Uncharacterized protein n=1 Tax=Pyrrhoderma noxium TaxID=2282107 RepID=A0A286UQ71_9AGAM|nr:hypothetical protein PNOK_0169500 [Pyrrhoderma noxium]
MARVIRKLYAVHPNVTTRKRREKKEKVVSRETNETNLNNKHTEQITREPPSDGSSTGTSLSSSQTSETRPSPSVINAQWTNVLKAITHGQVKTRSTSFRPPPPS